MKIKKEPIISTQSELDDLSPSQKFELINNQDIQTILLGEGILNPVGFPDETFTYGSNSGAGNNHSSMGGHAPYDGNKDTNNYIYVQNADAYSSISTNEEIYKLNSVQIWHRTGVNAAQRPNTYIVQGFRNGYWYELQQFTPTYSTAQIITLELSTQPTALFYSGFKLIGRRGSNEFITFVEIEWNVSYETPTLFIDGLYYKDANGEIYSSSSGGS
ncbi:hypothetical protein N9M92_01550 [Flavobacteriaceae bacterium]|nr:hypothetical protein [Flavobacteriaceae bacterium]